MVKVAPGHFRNHLMPKLLAVPNIDKFAFLTREQRKLYQRDEEETLTEVPKADDASRQQEEKMKEHQMAAKRLDNAFLAARQLCINIHPDNLHLPLPLASLGEYEVPLHLPKDIPRPEGRLQWTLNIKIRRK